MQSGEVAEWLNAAVSKTVVPSGTGSSNLPLSAINEAITYGATANISYDFSKECFTESRTNLLRTNEVGEKQRS